MTEGKKAEVFDCHDVIVQRTRKSNWFVLYAVLMMTVGLPFFALMLGWIGAIAALLSCVWLWVHASRLLAEKQRGGTLTLDDGALRLVDEQSVFTIFKVDEIATGYELASSNIAVLELRHGACVLIRLRGADEGAVARVLEHARVGPKQRAITMPLRRMVGAFVMGLVAFVSTLLASGFVASLLRQFLGSYAGLLAFALSAIVTAVVVTRYGSPRVVVGTDGIRLLGVLRPRFIPHAEVVDITLVHPEHRSAMTAPAVRVSLRDGSHVDLPTVTLPNEQMEALARRMKETAHAGLADHARRIEALARGDRSVSEWRKDVARVAVAEPGFREHALAREDFERVLGDASAPVDQRVGAALALRVVDPEGGASRIRIAAEGSADERLREALSAAAEPHVDDLALDELTRRSSS